MGATPTIGSESLVRPRLVLASACALRPSRDGQETVRPTLCWIALPSSLWAGPPLWESGIMGHPPPGSTLVLPSPPPSNPWKTSRGLGARGRGFVVRISSTVYIAQC